jgi:glycolate oxidase
MSLRATLAAIVGERYVFDDPERVEPYGRDEYPRVWSRPRAVVLPGCSAEVAEVVRACYRADVPVTPRGRGSGLTGGAVPLHDSVVVALERMEGITEIDEENQVVTTAPGTIVQALRDAVEARGLYYPPDPASLESCSIGGNVAENAGGPRALKYGVTRHYLAGLEVVLPGGDTARYGGKVLKNTTGYDLTHLFVGSEGTLGIITGITLRLIPLPPAVQDLLVPFPTLTEASAAVGAILRRLRMVPAVLEFMDQNSVRVAEKATGREFPYGEAGGQLLIQLDGGSPEEVEAQALLVGELCLDLGAEDVLVATSRPVQDRLWEHRRAVLEACKSTSRAVEFHDLSVPRARIPELVAAMHRLGSAAAMTVACFGHAGDGNVHVGFMSQDPEAFAVGLDDLNAAVVRETVELGGSFSGEHGTGCVKRKYLPWTAGRVELGLMRSLKSALDPRGLMNPGKILPG